MRISKWTRWGLGLTIAGLLFASLPAEARGKRGNRFGFLFGQGTNQNLAERLTNLGEFNILLTALEEADLAETVATAEALTVMAPTDAAFGDLLEQLDATPEDLLGNPDLANILLYHVIGGKQTAGRLLFNTTVESLNDGQPLFFRVENRTVFVNDARVKRANLRASNGIIHVIDSVLLPPTETVAINSLVDILALDGRFGTLIAAASEAGLVGALTGEDELTVFAPTDEAFADLLATLGVSAEQLLANPDLASILLYHVVPGSQRAFPLLLQRDVETLNGEDVFVRISGGGVQVNDANVISPNLAAPNGVIHVIDKVLLP